MMNGRNRCSLKPSTVVLISLVAACLQVPATAQTLPKCGQDHPGREHRAESLLKRGDARMAESAAGHVVLYAIERYRIKDIVNDSSKDRAMSEMYEFLKWKLGNPSAVAAQWLTAGYQHFDNGYVDEAAAALLGYSLPKEKGGHSVFYIPPDLVELWMMLEKLGNVARAYVLQAYLGIPPALSRSILDWTVEQEGKVGKRLGFNIPKEYDFPNGLLTLTIEARRNPAATKAKFQRWVDEAARR